MDISIRELMGASGVKFGTSGARGLAEAMTDYVCHAYTQGFLQYLRRVGDIGAQGTAVAFGGDLRPSTDRIMGAVSRAIIDLGCQPICCGKAPSPAVALCGFQRGIPSIMVTGSHIPDDRNGIKFNKAAGEVLKDDEAGMMAQKVPAPSEAFGPDGMFRKPSALPPVDAECVRAYIHRYLQGFPGAPLAGARVGVYQHSAVGRDVVAEILRGLGAEVLPFGRSERFVPVDTEAIREEDVAVARQFAAENSVDAIVSTDGDSDRPLVSDERGEWLRGDIAGILVARFLGADSVSTPVSSNTAVEQCGWFPEVRRTRIGSPYVIASMLAAKAEGRQRVVGYEANGGFLTHSGFSLGGSALDALPTRDAAIVMLGVLLLARREKRRISELLATLPARHTASDRLQEIPVERSQALISRLNTGNAASDQEALNALLGTVAEGRVIRVDTTDGSRATFDNGRILHLRPSGNAPEFRCYAEAESAAVAEALCARGLEALRAELLRDA